MTRLWASGEPVDTWGEGEAPAGFTWQGAIHPVEAVCNRWRVHARWWEDREMVWREYVKVTTGTGLLCLLYHDLVAGGWYLARVYD